MNNNNNDNNDNNNILCIYCGDNLYGFKSSNIMYQNICMDCFEGYNETIDKYPTAKLEELILELRKNGMSESRIADIRAMYGSTNDISTINAYVQNVEDISKYIQLFVENYTTDLLKNIQPIYTLEYIKTFWTLSILNRQLVTEQYNALKQYKKNIGVFGQ